MTVAFIPNFVNNLTPYVKLGRYHKPVGIWLLMWPTLWGLAWHHITDIKIWVVCIGASALVRGAGSAFNDWVDRPYDGQVRRTKDRPLVTAIGISSQGALVFCSLQLLLAFMCAVWLQVIWLSVFALALIGTYPFLKRYTYWPQAFLGLAMNYGWIVAWGIGGYPLDWTVLLVYGAAISWTIAYDTIYAYQDRDDDLMLGLKSTAILFAHRARLCVGLFQSLFVIGFLVALYVHTNSLKSPLLLGPVLVWNMYGQLKLCTN
jgi:4-hydroxybenzoate polyprenyltransferase